MDCELVLCDLPAYHAGAMSDDENEQIDSHLLCCGECLRRYLTFKRESGRETPSQATRERLRASVAAEFRPHAGVRLLAWFSRPIPLYKGLAVAAVVVFAAIVGPQVAPRKVSPLKSRGEQIDTSRQSGEREGVL